MHYRAYLYDPTVPRPERPVQAFFVTLSSAEDWADKLLRSAGEGSEVWLYELEETLVGSWKRKPKTEEDVKTPKQTTNTQYTQREKDTKDAV